MKEMLLNEWRRHYYVGRPPSPKTIKKWIEEGDLPGKKRGNSYVVFVDDHGNPAESTGNPLADTVLSRWHDKQPA